MKKILKLKLRRIIKVKPSRPFAFDLTFFKPDHFTAGDNYWQAGIRWQTWNWQGHPMGVKFINQGTVNNPLVEIKIFAKDKLTTNLVDSLLAEIKYLYNFDLNLTDFYKTFNQDPSLAPILKKMIGMRPGHPSSLYEYLIIGMVLQNATIRRSVQMFETLLANYGTLVEFNGKRLWCFWSPGRFKNITEDELRKLKVGYRAKSIKKIDEYFSQGLIVEKQLREKSREVQSGELLKLYGVGPATLWYLLFDIFHHWDFFNHISPWEQKIYSKLFFNQDPVDPVAVDKILKYFSQFGKYRQLVVHYVWEDLFWQRRKKSIPWLDKEIRL